MADYKAIAPYAAHFSRPLEAVGRDLESYAALLKKWQAVQNLVSRETLDAVWERHFADSLQILQLFEQSEREFMDLGSGGGFPALPLAIASKGLDRHFVLVEPTARKVSFLRTVARELDLNVTVIGRRSDEIDSRETPVPDVITSRALAALPLLCDWMEPFFAAKTRAILHKGREHVNELTESGAHWHYDVVVNKSDTDPGGVILSITNLKENQRLSGTTGGLLLAPRILTLANQKGGVGKTTTAINLATALAAIGERVLIVDLDPQGNASTGLGISRDNREVSSYDVLVGEASVAQAAIMTSVPNVAIIPSTMDLLGVELTIAGQADRAFKLRDAFKQLSDLRINDQAVSYILIDCPPSLNLLTVNSLVAADAVLVPLQCEFFALEGLSQLLQTIEQIRSTLNPRLSIQGVVMTMFDKRNNLSEQVLADVRSEMGDLVYDTVIPRNVRLSEAPSYGKPALLYDLKCAGSQAYLRLATEVIRRERRLVAA